MTRLEVATMILNGMISADWNLPIPDGKTWDDAAVDRAYALADLLIKMEKVETVEPKKKPNLKPVK
jgi:SHS2 domain-containing protein